MRAKVAPLGSTPQTSSPLSDTSPLSARGGIAASTKSLKPVELKKLYKSADNDSIDSGATPRKKPADDEMSLNSVDFELAQETFFDYRISRPNTTASSRKKSVDFDMFCLDAPTKKPPMGPKKASHATSLPSTIRERTMKVHQKANLELSSIRSTVSSTVCNKDLHSPDHLKTIFDLNEDLRQEKMEKWLHYRGKTTKMKNEDKRKLRTWFRELDHDESGEVNADELQDPMISFGVLKSREQVVRLLNNIDKNKTTGIDFDEFLEALNSKETSSNIQSLQRMQQMHSNTVGFSVNTLITVERRKKLIYSVMKSSEKRNREVEFAFLRVLHGRGRIDEASNKSLSTLESKQHRSMRLNDKYLRSLNLVVQSKKKQSEIDDEEAEEDLAQKLEYCESLSAEKIREMARQKDTTLLDPAVKSRYLQYYKSLQRPDEYGGISSSTTASEVSDSWPSGKDPALVAILQPSEIVPDIDPSSKRCAVYAPASNGPHTKVPGLGIHAPRRPALCSSLPPAPAVVSLERSEFSKSIRGPLSRSLLDSSLFPKG